MDEGTPNASRRTGDSILLIACSILFFVVADYGIDMHKVYPVWVISAFREPWVRFLSYVTVYVAACINVHLSVLLALALVFLHIDYLNLVRQKPMPMLD